MLIDRLNEISANKVENLDLTGTYFFEDDFELLCTALQNNTSIQFIDISFCNLIDSEFNELAKALIKRPSLIKLNIQDNLLKNESLPVIIELIKSGKVNEVEFEKNQFDKNTAEYLSFKEQLFKYAKNTNEEKRNSFSSQTTDESSGNLSTPPSPSLFQPNRPSTPIDETSSLNTNHLNNSKK